MLPSISLITPTHRPNKLLRLYESIKTQTDKDFEWVVIPNNGADVSFLPKEDWIVIKPYTDSNKNIGALKNFGFSQGRGELLVEVDHDDELTSNCVELLNNNKNKGDFIYSNNLVLKTIEEEYTWGPAFNWKYKNFDYKGKTYRINKAFPAYPGNFAWQWWAPNHVRAWRKDFYEKIGGHDITLKACDDGDLICRSMIYGKIHYIDEVLYVYYLHPENSHASNDLRDWIQKHSEYMHLHYIPDMAKSWSRNNNYEIAIEEEIFTKTDNSTGYIVLPPLNKMDKIERYMKQAYKILVPGGIIIVTNPINIEKKYPRINEKHIPFWNKPRYSVGGVKLELNAYHMVGDIVTAVFTKYSEDIHIARPEFKFEYILR